MDRKVGMKIIIPMVGKGSRFKTTGINLPKPLIPVRGMPMFLWSIKNLPHEFENYIFICLKEQIELFQIDKQIRRYLSELVTVVACDQATDGQACTVLLAEDLIGNEPIIIHNVDTFFGCDMSFINDNTIDGAIPYFESADPAMSYLRFGQSNRVVEMAEKKMISTHATIGLYYFTRGSDFIWAAKRMIAENFRVNNEFYVGPVYNYLIEKGCTIVGVPANYVWDLGTLEKIELFERLYESHP